MTRSKLPHKSKSVEVSTSEVTKPATSCGEVCAIPLASIVVDAKRRRAVNPDTVNELCRAFQVQGQLQPIGVQRKPDSFYLRLVFGYHRFLAKQKQAEEFGPAENTILATIFPAEMPDWQCEAIEIAENLIREELSPAERAAHTTAYLALLKRYGNVVDSNTARKAHARNQYSEGVHQHAGDPPSLTVEGGGNGFRDPPSLTATEKTSCDLGITDRTVRNRVRKTRELAASVGVTTTNTTPEKMTADELETISKAALGAKEATGEISQLEKRTGHDGKS